jgi:hypothetical protein
MPWLEKHKAGGWVVRWWTAGRGSAKGRSDPLPNKPAAEVESRRIAGELAARRPVRVDVLIPWAQLITRYLDALAAKGKGSHRYPAHVRQVLTALGPARGWTHARDVTPATAGGLTVTEHRYVKALLRFAVLLDQPVHASALRLPRPAKPRVPAGDLLTEAEVGKLLARAKTYSPDLHATGHLVATYGHRPESLTKMTVQDVDLANGQISMPVKSGDRIRHPITGETAAILRRLIKGRDPAAPLIQREDGTAWASGDRLSTYWYHQVGEHVTPDRPGIYHLKRRAISRMLAAGLDVATIASMTGHRTPSVILTYARTNEAAQRRAVAALESLACPAVPRAKKTKARKSLQ